MERKMERARNSEKKDCHKGKKTIRTIYLIKEEERREDRKQSKKLNFSTKYTENDLENFFEKFFLHLKQMKAYKDIKILNR